MNSKVYLVPGIGNVTITKHHLAKHIKIKIKADKSTQVTIPRLMPYRMGMQFVIEKKEWVIKHQNNIECIQPKAQLYTVNSVFKTRYTEIRFKYYKGAKPDSFYKENCYYLCFPEDQDIQTNNNQTIIKTYIIETLRREAKKHLPQRTLEFAEKYGFQVKQVFIKNLKSRWGSCSGQNNVNLNLHLMRLPEYLSDFIILHELCHTVHKNHGKDFHRLLNQLVGDEKKLNNELRKYSIYL